MFKNIKGNGTAMNRQGKLLTLVVFLLLFLFMISLFKNISYPLFWADESMTVIGGGRVLQFGYPKVHDGKNVFYDLQYTDKSLGIDRRTDAYIGGANWGQYYIAALGVKLAEISDDFFVKTGLIRTIFALFGLTGLILLALLGTHFFHSGYSRMGFLALFALFETLSVPLVLHLREARYYALAVCLSALVVFIYARYRILEKTRYPEYVILLLISLLLLFNTFSPAYFVFLGAVSLFEAVSLAGYLLLRGAGKVRAGSGPSSPGTGPFRRYLRNMLPWLLSLLPVYPLMVFFDVVNISDKLSKYYTWGFSTDAAGMYLDNLSFIWNFFASSDLIYLAIFLKIVLLSCFLARAVRDKNMHSSFDVPKVTFSAFLSTVFIVYFFALPKIPNPLFTRYFIVLQPILTLVILMDMAAILGILSRYRSTLMPHCKRALVAVFVAFTLLNVSNNFPFLKGHVFELTHRYRGPLDYVIPFAREKYGSTDDLVIATNYEETSFMYYLDAKVTVGYVGNNLKEDVKVQPDIIVYRKSWENFKPVFLNFIQRYPYEEISFPVVDHPVNNIPELHREWPRHQFRTLECEDEWTRTYIFVKK